MKSKIEKTYWVLLMYGIGRDELDFWSRMEYDLAYQEIIQLWKPFLKFHKERLTEDYYSVVLGYLRNHIPNTTKI